MARIFLSHSSKDNAAARALGDWLVSNGWSQADIFLDIDNVGGIAPGERWQRALMDAAGRCEVVIFLVSRHWLSSQWCHEELALAHKLNKRLLGALVGTVALGDIPSRLRDEWQLVDLDGARDGMRLDVELPGGKEGFAIFSRSGLEKLRLGLIKAGLDPEYFPWPPVGDPARAPYRGLVPMEAEDAGIFYGREAATIAAMDQIRGLSETVAPRLLAILGASGAGKSSFMRAGLIPRLKRDDHHFLVLPVVRPQRAVITGDSGLAAALAAAGETFRLRWTRAQAVKAIASGADSVAALLVELTAAAIKSLGNSGGATPPTIIVPLDQAEELFHADGGVEATVLLNLTADLLGREEFRLIALATIRTDSYELMQAAPALTDIRQATFSLPALARGSYQRVIEAPVERLRGSDRALRIEPALTGALLADIEEGGAKDALPLLAFTMERLYREYGTKGELTLADYRDSGGIGGAIEAAVERALAAADGDPRLPFEREARLALLRRAMIPWLAGIDPDTNSPRRQVARFADIPDEARPLVEYLVEQRLVTSDTSPTSGERTVEPAHEALLRQWGLVDGWLKEDIAVLASFEGVRRAARDWDANARQEGWLQHAGSRLADAESVQARADLARRLDAADLAYLAACRTAENARVERETRSARRIRIFAIAAMIAAVVAAGAAWWGLDRAEFAQIALDGARNSALEAAGERARLLITAGRTSEASTILGIALRNADWKPGDVLPKAVRESALGAAIEDRYGPSLTLEKEISWSSDTPLATFSADGALLALVHESDFAVWETETGKELRSGKSAGHVFNLGFSRDGAFLLLSGRFGDDSDRTNVRVVDLNSNRMRDFAVESCAEGLPCVQARSPDAKLVDIGEADLRTAIEETAAPMQSWLVPLRSSDQHFLGVALNRYHFYRVGALLVVWDVSTGRTAALDLGDGWFSGAVSANKPLALIGFGVEGKVFAVELFDDGATLELRARAPFTPPGSAGTTNLHVSADGGSFYLSNYRWGTGGGNGRRFTGSFDAETNRIGWSNDHEGTIVYSASGALSAWARDDMTDVIDLQSSRVIFSVVGYPLAMSSDETTLAVWQRPQGEAAPLSIRLVDVQHVKSFVSEERTPRSTRGLCIGNAPFHQLRDAPIRRWNKTDWNRVETSQPGTSGRGHVWMATIVWEKAETGEIEVRIKEHESSNFNLAPEDANSFFRKHRQREPEEYTMLAISASADGHWLAILDNQLSWSIHDASSADLTRIAEGSIEDISNTGYILYFLEHPNLVAIQRSDCEWGIFELPSMKTVATFKPGYAYHGYVAMPSPTTLAVMSSDWYESTRSVQIFSFPDMAQGPWIEFSYDEEVDDFPPATGRPSQYLLAGTEVPTDFLFSDEGRVLHVIIDRATAATLAVPPWGARLDDLLRELSVNSTP